MLGTVASIGKEVGCCNVEWGGGVVIVGTGMDCGKMVGCGGKELLDWM